MKSEKDNRTTKNKSLLKPVKSIFLLNLLVFLLIFFSLQLQAQTINQKSKLFDLPNKIVIDFSNDYAQITYNQASQAQFLSEITFIGKSTNNSNFTGFPQMSANNIVTLEIQFFTEDDFLALQNRLRKTNHISRLIIKNSRIKSIPVEFITDHDINDFHIENCRSIDPISLNQLLNQENNLLKLTVKNCGIYKISSEVTSNKIRVLNLSNNKLASVTSFLPLFPRLDSLFIEGNNLPDLEFELESCANSKLKYIRTDSVSPALEKSLREINNQLSWDFGPMAESVKKRLNHYGNFSIGNKNYQVLSSAYLNYNAIFNNRLLRINFDTLFADEKFWDTISTVYRLSPDNAINYRLFRHKGFQRGHITFNYYPKRNRSSKRYSSPKFFKNHPEATIYRDYIWVTSNPIKPKEFAPLLKKYFMDIRFEYHPQTKNYTIHLKENTGKIISIEAYPIKKKIGKNVNIEDKDLEKDYAKYLSALARKNRKIDKETIKTKRQIRNSLAQIERNCWHQLRSMMSPEERLMSEEEWMSYYVEILSHEAEALETCFPSNVYLQKSLNLLGYSPLGNINDTTSTALKNVSFVDETGSNIPVKEIYVINHKSLTFRNYQFTATIQAITMGLIKEEDISMVIILPDNSFGLVDRKEVSSTINSGKTFNLKAQITKYDLITIGQIIDYLNL